VTRVCVFAGSSTGARSDYGAAARSLAAELVGRGLGLVYGGGSVGLMGVLADAVRARGGEVIGVIPAPLATKELVHTGLTELRVVGGMHERKATMAALADAFVALPGGLGTLEETLEMLTWVQLGIHAKPVGVLNVAGYYDPLLDLLARAVREGFILRENFALLLAGNSAAELLDRFAAWQPPPTTRVWLTPRQS
jgi:uncharacterized protein (TIGR00730 family)